MGELVIDKEKDDVECAQGESRALQTTDNATNANDNVEADFEQYARAA